MQQGDKYKLYMPSTPLNILVSCAIALQQKKLEAEKVHQQLWLIDQRLDKQNNPYFKALMSWNNSPFESIRLFGSGSGGRSKIAHRRHVLEEMGSLLNTTHIDEVLVGSDRRVEFQYVMNLLTATKKQTTKGVYIDDGLYSYSGRKQHKLKDSVNAILKKCFYGAWWQEPSTVGASSWIEKAWLFKPEKAYKSLQAKQLYQLDTLWFEEQALVELSSLLAKELKFDLSELTEIDLMVLIPHPNNIKKMSSYKTNISRLIKVFASKGLKVGVKYHPRTQGEDPLNLIRQGANCLVPSMFAFEFCLPILPGNCTLVGDVGTALLSARWLRPNLNVIAVLNPLDTFQKRFIEVSELMGVKVVDDFEEIEDVA